MFTIATPNFIFVFMVLCKYILGIIVKKCFQMPLKKHVIDIYLTRGRVQAAQDPLKASLLLADDTDY